MGAALAAASAAWMRVVTFKGLDATPFGSGVWVRPRAVKTSGWTLGMTKESMRPLAASPPRPRRFARPRRRRR